MMSMAEHYSGQPCGIIKGAFGRMSLNALSRPLAPHAHSEFNILVKLGGSDCEFRSGKDRFHVQESSALLFNRWQPHCKMPNPGEPTLFLSLLIDPHWMHRRHQLPDNAFDRLFAKTSVSASGVVMRTAKKILAATSTQSAAVAAGRFETLIADLVAAVIEDHVEAVDEKDARRKPVDARIVKALRLLRKQPSGACNLAELAREVGLSRSRFFQQFRNCVGTSPQHYIDWLRIAAAIDQVLDTTLPFGKIAENLGFGEHTHFTRFFVQHTGMTPSEFRRVALVVD